MCEETLPNTAAGPRRNLTVLPWRSQSGVSYLGVGCESSSNRGHLVEGASGALSLCKDSPESSILTEAYMPGKQGGLLTELFQHQPLTGRQKLRCLAEIVVCKRYYERLHHLCQRILFER
jgi:hypothetical protein